jgi:phosphopantothenoylcysteine synthetase/decarboxylase
MNDAMWSKPTTERHVEALRAQGHTVVDPVRQPVFELWSRTNVVGPSMPPPDEAAELIAKWLETQLAAD